jgi:hypothetical protein
MSLICATYSARSTVTTLAAILFSCLILLGEGAREIACDASGGAHAATENTPDPLIDLNQAFRQAYASCRQKLVERGGPVIVVEGDNLVLLHLGKRREARVVPDIYHTLKAVSHVPLAIYVMLLPFEGAALNEECLAGLRAYRERVALAEPSVKNCGLSEDALLRQQEIIRVALRFLDSVIDKKQVTANELRKFTGDLGKELLANAVDAAHAQLDALDKQVNAWRAALPADNWKKLHVVVMGSALPRKGNLAIQYFAHLLNEKGEGTRIVYAESLFDETRAVNLLGTHLLDTRIGLSFFDDAERMHRDLLSDAASEYLKTNFPR